jgi:hypothetical protein
MLIRATPLKDFLTTALSTTAIGTAYSTIAPEAGQRVYAGWHLTSASAASTARVLVVTVQSASSSGFAAATTEISFALTSSEGSSWGSAVSPSTDRPWRRALLTMSTAASTANTWKGLVWTGIK